MSRIGKMPIDVPQGVTVDISKEEVAVKGPKGELKCSVDPDMIITLDKGVLTVMRPTDGREHRSMHGLTRTLVANMVEGVTRGFQKVLEIVGRITSYNVCYTKLLRVTLKPGDSIQFFEGA